MKKYSEEIKRTMVAKMVGPGAKTASVLAKEVGITQTSLSRWLKEFEPSQSGRARRPRDWSAAEKLAALKGTASMEEAELGEYLRRHGLHSVHLEQWSQEYIDAMDGRVNRRQTAEERRKVKELERELRRKDKALAEATALLILKKKAALIWGDLGEEESS